MVSTTFKKRMFGVCEDEKGGCIKIDQIKLLKLN